MQWKYRVKLGMIAGITIILPMALLADGKDKEKDGKKQAKGEAAGQRHGSKTSPQVARGHSTQSSGRSHGASAQKDAAVSRSASGKGYGGYASRSVNAPDTDRKARVSQSTARSSDPVSRLGSSERDRQQSYSSRHQSYSGRQQYTRSNNYGGLWFPESTHRDWDRRRQYSWNSHNYRWYEGGWLIIDAGFNPYYAGAVYSSRGATVSDVQIVLADRGYYRGPIDGYIGYGTRSAIVRYQDDHDLMVTGSVNDSLLRSMRL